MATLQDYRNERLRKLNELRELGIDTYPAKSYRTHQIGDVTAKFDQLEGKQVTIDGRIISIRKFGKLAFIVLRDQTGEVQLFIQDGTVEHTDAVKGFVGIKDINLLDTGDFVEAIGEVMKTKTGEISVGTTSLRLLTKALRPMPTELTNKEERFRRRYVDMNVNLDVRERFMRRSKFWQATRQFLLDEGFVEINIPVLEHTTGGADANPFVTHMDALDDQLFEDFAVEQFAVLALQAAQQREIAFDRLLDLDDQLALLVQRRGADGAARVRRQRQLVARLRPRCPARGRGGPREDRPRAACFRTRE